MKPFFGKHRGKVEDNQDPLHLGRLKVQVPSVLSDEGGWAMPCVPFAGPNEGFFMIPDKGANVWVEFEGGDPDYPIWSGCFWGDGELPTDIPREESANLKVIRTNTATVLLSDEPGGKGGITIEGQFGHKITMTDAGIEITNGKASVKMSQGEVTIKETLDVG